jgi:arylsulfatase A-like enzyme
MTRRQFLAMAGAAAVTGLSGCTRWPARAARRNLLLIVSDTLRADHLEALGCPLPITPNLNRLAARGVCFEKVVASAPLTAASHATMMTGVYQTRHQVVENHGEIPREVPTLAEALREEGYETAAFISNPTLMVRSVAGIERGFRRYDEEFASRERNREALYREARDTSEAGLRWLRRRARRPFFLWLHYQEPHGPYEVPDASLLERAAGLPRGNPPGTRIPVLAGEFGPGGIPRYQVLGKERRPYYYRTRYAARVAYMDQQVGRVLEEVERSGMAEDTLVVFTSDHGELMGEHDYWFQHGITLLQAVLRVPLVIAGPGVEAGRRVPLLAGTVDLMPTALELLGLLGDELSGKLQGRSLAPEVRGEAAGPQARYFAACLMSQELGLLQGNLKYTLRKTPRGERAQLVDWEADPGEEQDVGARRPEASQEMAAALREFDREKPDLLTWTDRLAGALTEEDKRRLRALGYVR